MQSYEVLRDREADLAFNGKLLGFGSSRKDETQPRWLEVSIYRTAGSKLVVSIVGRTVVDDEVNRFDGHVYETPAQVFESLHRQEKACPSCGWASKRPYCKKCNRLTEPTGNLYLTSAAREALEQAALIDDEFDDVLVMKVD